MKNRKLPKIKANLDVKRSAMIGVRQLKEYIYNKRAHLTKEEVDSMLSDVAERIYALAYQQGWEDRNEIHKVRKSSNQIKILKAWNDFYNDRITEITLDCMENVRYIVDIALLNRSFDITKPLKRQVNDHSI